VKLYKIGERLYVSPRPTEEWPLYEAGITHIVQVCTKPTDQTYAIGRSHWALPLKDGDAEGQVIKLRTAVTHVLEKLAAGETVLVHCIEGRNRSMLVATLVEKRRRGWTGEEAYQHAQQVRPRCLYNPSFAPWLRSLP